MAMQEKDNGHVLGMFTWSTKKHRWEEQEYTQRGLLGISEEIQQIITIIIISDSIK